MVLLLEAKDAGEWDYRGEGAANVVMVYCGTSPDFLGRVLRVQKTASMVPNGGSSEMNASLLSTEEKLLWSDWQEVVAANSKEVLAQAYAQHVIGPLLGSDCVDPGTLVQVSKEFLDALDQNIYDQRPAWRIEATKINLQSGFALLMSDHASFLRGLDGATPCISVEIKPKCGFLPCSRFISSENHLKRIVSRFAMHQHLKFSQEKVACISKYSPLDLFSESRDRIHQAIGELFETPQNNLRIFLNGSLVFGGLGGYAEEGLLNGYITEMAFKNLEGVLENVMSCQKGECMTCFQDLMTESLLQSGMLSKLLRVQKMDMYDIEGAIHAYFNIIKEPCQICTCSSEEGNISTAEKKIAMPDEPMEKCSEENYSFIDSLSSENKSNSDNHMQNHIHEYFSSLSLEESRKMVRDFLLATTAKDCSLMLTFQPVHHNATDVNSLDGNNVISLTGTNQTFRYKARYIDLDLKRLENMMHYYKLDQKIVNVYTRIHGANKSPKP